MESQPVNGSPMPARATMQDIQALLNGEALNHLAPVPGGRWQMLSRVNNIILVAYVLEDGTQVMTTTVNLAFDAETATTLCWQHIYNFPAGCNPDGTWADESPQAPPAINSNVQMATSAPMNQQVDNTWTAGPTVLQAGGAPVLAIPQLDASYQPINTVQGQQQPHEQAQALVAPGSGAMGPFQHAQPIDMAGGQPGDLSAFQDGSHTIFDAGQFVAQNGPIQNIHQWQPFP
ncbi:mating type protein MAT1-2-3 [Fusarium redolens]|uniref:Mating type protein MAT1-2-3 n=1 Tax=Fusarium redolens TaxID=48865 RepID=A0A9P9KJ01_FUSRE|nr:mating type protein MAT1-2-3 [Fusarium redolens]KAH7264762.1 mating type protein MAT1-2-3 [Fusarium redolens]